MLRVAWKGLLCVCAERETRSTHGRGKERAQELRWQM